LQGDRAELVINAVKFIAGHDPITNQQKNIDAMMRSEIRWDLV